MISPVQPWVAERTGLKENLSSQTLRAWQLDKVRNTIDYARNNSSFYCKRLKEIDTSNIISVLDMEEIPFTYPEDIIIDSKAFVCVPPREISRITSLSTSGSQGSSKRIYFTENDLTRTLDFFSCGMSTMVHSGQSTLIMMSNRSENSIADLLQRALEQISVSSDIHGNVKDVTAALEAAKGYNCLVGVPAEIIYLCRTDDSLRPESVLLSADYVPESVIKYIEGTWHCKVFTHYGMTETGFGGGVQCDAGAGYHLRDADLLIEIVDIKTGKQLKAGEYGEVVLTTLQNEAMPLIRYRTGDIARILIGTCSCGGILPRLDRVRGRSTNTIRLENGESISIHDLDEIMFAVPGLMNYSAKLVGRNSLLLTVDT
ncbi:MAG TPA: phenylacetate--CoA ligase family protein, partial [Negativicutes bacterium]|nr:phenylacetate--CoA ligase family protein [Negativicutes bacterium]